MRADVQPGLPESVQEEASLIQSAAIHRARVLAQPPPVVEAPPPPPPAVVEQPQPAAAEAVAVAAAAPQTAPTALVTLPSADSVVSRAESASTDTVPDAVVSTESHAGRAAVPPPIVTTAAAAPAAAPAAAMAAVPATSAAAPPASLASVCVEYVRVELTPSQLRCKMFELPSCPLGYLVVAGVGSGACRARMLCSTLCALLIFFRRRCAQSCTALGCASETSSSPSTTSLWRSRSLRRYPARWCTPPPSASCMRDTRSCQRSRRCHRPTCT